MKTLEELLAEKKKIEQEIRQLKDQSKICGKAKLDVEHYPTNREDRHYCAIKYKTIEGYERWVSVISGYTKVEVVGKIPEIIRDLQGLIERNES